MRAHKPGHQRKPRRSFLCVTLLVVCALLTHSLDNCAAHLGELPRTVPQAQQAGDLCPNPAGTCEICTPTNEPHSDGCDLLSEVAVLTSSQHPLEHQAVTLAATVAVLPATPQLIALSGCLHGRAGPPPALPALVCLRSSLSSRAPPISA